MNENDQASLGVTVFNLFESLAWRRVEDLVRSVASGTPVERAQFVIDSVQARLREATNTRSSTTTGAQHYRS